MEGEVFIADPAEFNANPTPMADIGRSEEGIGVVFDEDGLETGRDGQPDGNVTIIMVVVGEHDKDLLLDEEGWFAVRELFAGFGKGQTEAADSLQRVMVHIGG